MGTTPGQQGVIRWVPETTPGTFPTNPALKLFSRETLNVKLMLDVGEKESLDIGNVDVEEYFKVLNSYGFTVECHGYDVQRLLDFITRNADNSLKTYGLEYIPNQDQTTKWYYRGVGWRMATLEVSGKAGEPFVFKFEFKGGKWSNPVSMDPGIGTGSRELKSAITQSIVTFATAPITVDAAPWGVILNEFSFKVENKVAVYHDTGDPEPEVAVVSSAPRRLSGQGNVSLDDGASTEWLRTKNYTAASIIVPFGGSGSPMVTLGGCHFPTIEVESVTDKELLMGARPFTAATITLGTVP